MGSLGDEKAVFDAKIATVVIDSNLCMRKQ